MTIRFDTGKREKEIIGGVEKGKSPELQEEGGDNQV